MFILLSPKQVNKEQAEKCRDLGAAALRQGEYPQAVKMLQKSLSLFPLPGVDALYTHAQSKLLHRNSNTTNGSPNTSTADSTDSRRESTKPNNSNTANHTTTSNNTNNTSRSSNAAAATSSNSNGADGRAYTTDQVALVKRVLTAKETGGRGAHYRVLEIAASATESEIKKAYRKLSLKVHPDKVCMLFFILYVFYTVECMEPWGVWFLNHPGETQETETALYTEFLVGKRTRPECSSILPFPKCVSMGEILPDEVSDTSLLFFIPSLGCHLTGHTHFSLSL